MKTFYSRVAVAALLLTAACSADNGVSPTAAPATGKPSATPQLLATGCPAINLDKLILDALPNGIETAVASQFASVEQKYDAFKIAPAQSKAVELVAFIQKKYDDGKFELGQTREAQLQLLQLKTAILCLVGLPYPTSTEIGGVTVGIVYPTTETTIARQDKLAAATFPAGAVQAATEITIERITTPLPTDLTQYPLFFKFSAPDGLVFNQQVSVAICLDGEPPANAGVDLRLARGTTPSGSVIGDIEILPPVTGGPLNAINCDGSSGKPLLPVNIANPSPTLHSAFFTAERLLGRMASRLSPAFTALFLPSELHAATLLGCCKLGGLTGSFSPFGAVDINSAKIEKLSPGEGTSSPAGAVVPTTVRVYNRDTDKGLRGVDVKFVVAAGGGTVAPAIVQTNQSGDGRAVTSWTLGAEAGSNTLNASGLLGRSVVRPIGTSLQVPIPGSPVTFTVDGFTVPSFGFGANGWDARSFSSEPNYTQIFVGEGAFGQGGFADALNTGCAVSGPSATKSTFFPLGVSDQVPSYLAITREFSAPAGAKLSVSIDNDFKVFLNGTLLTTGVTGRAYPEQNPSTVQTPDPTGFFRHEYCPTVTGNPAVPAGDFLVPLTGLRPGTNTITILGRDRGGSAFLDAAIVP